MRGFNKMKNLAIMAGRRVSVIFRRFSLVFLCFALIAGIEFNFYDKNFITINKAEACAPCDCVAVNHEITRLTVALEHGFGFFLSDPEVLAYTPAHICLPGLGTRGWIGYQFCRHREEFIVFYWFKEHILAAMMMMTEQLVSGAMNQMFILGTFFDAKMQLETQQLFQELTAQAHKDYHPAFGMCEIGTLSRSLSNSQRRGEFNAFAMSQHMMDRGMRNYTMGSAAGGALDTVHRWEQFRSTFCNPHDNDGELGPRTTTPICAGSTLANYDRDIDYGMVVDFPNTLNVDYTNGAPSAADEEIFALASNLYGSDVFAYYPESFLKDENKEDEYMFVRSIQAKRSVAQNSFNAIVGMKSRGAAITADELRPYMELVMEQLGVADVAYIDDYIGERPSYYSQMEFLTKKLYQRPEFYTDLYDKPVNVERKKAALRAIGLVQNMDLFKSKLRTEAALSVLTEMEIQKAQDALQERMNQVGDSGIRSGP